MLKANVYEFAGAALVMGGPVVGLRLRQRGRQLAAADELDLHDRLTAQRLQSRIDLAERRERARELGVDPDEVEQRLRELGGGDMGAGPPAAE